MASNVTIGGNGTLFVGEDKTLRCEVLDVTDLPIDISSWTGVFDVRLKDNSPDPAILSKIPTVQGVYNVVRATNTQRWVVVLSDTEMNLFKAKTYRHSWKRTDTLSETVISRGNFAPEKATAP